MVKQIKLTQGKFALVDDEDFEHLNQWKWQVEDWQNKLFYATRKQHLGYFNGKQKLKRIFMHRLIINAPKELVVDHIDGNGLNNQRNNLRVCTVRQNCQNKLLPNHPNILESHGINILKNGFLKLG
jgi:hypothetical protein